ncbi:WD40-repeat-containing domain protein [Vararia minispora EC-137]|uniref:WD40-repeat-containing domain protein n=1 Tax=Vararia minispora EC-137 TaxID=1314806 RepID=A0ACB8QFV1_9AGAM|nr:WD40-repeat-containing domain protein [Vararia minispora EC-137]
MASQSTTVSQPSLPVIFTTKTPYPIPAQKFMVPASWRRYQLSQLINKALDLPQVVPFDFIVRGEILRGNLAEWARERGEETVELEYIESVMPPRKMAALPHEDWTSSISCQVPGRFLTSSYDGAVRIFDYSQKLLCTAPIHTACTTSVCAVPSTTERASDGLLLATSSHDLTARLTRVGFPDSPSEKEEITQLASLHLHTAPLSSIDVDPSGTKLLTASWDTLLGIFDTTIPSVDEVAPDPLPARQKKRRRVEMTEVPKKVPLAVLRSHTARVSQARWREGGKGAVSVGFDSAVRVWDVEREICAHTVSASEKPFLALALLSAGEVGGGGVLAASADRAVTLYDLRAESVRAASATFAHMGGVPSSLATGSKETQFVSGGYDGVVRLWDVRSAGKEMASFKVWEGKGEGKVLSVDWREDVVGIAGEGGVEVWRITEQGS